MTTVRARGEDIRRFILEHVEKHPRDIGRVTGENFKISRQAINKHLQKLCAEQALAEAGHISWRHLLSGGNVGR